MQLPAHGSNPHYLYKALEIHPPARIIDFSVNINPLGTSGAVKFLWQDWLDTIYDYPDPYCTDLKQTIVAKEGIEESYLLPGNGAAQLITLIARYFHGKKVLIIHPAFSEYESACRNEQCTILHHVLRAPDWKLEKEVLKQQLRSVDAVFFCHPNNPTGVQYDEATIEWLIGVCKHTKTVLIIDEAFYDFLTNPLTYIKHIYQSSYLLVLRSLTKMYSIAGLRLGFLAGQPELLEEVGKSQPHWSMNTIALKAGKVCLNDSQHSKRSREYVETERNRLFTYLGEKDFTYSPSTVNFYLFRDPLNDSQELFRFLLRKGLVLRHTYNFPGLEGKWLRAAVKKEEENNMLMEALAEWRREN